MVTFALVPGATPNAANNPPRFLGSLVLVDGALALAGFGVGFKPIWAAAIQDAGGCLAQYLLSALNLGRVTLRLTPSQEPPSIPSATS